MGDEEIDNLLRTLDFNAIHLSTIDVVTAAYYKQAASTIRSLRSERDYHKGVSLLEARGARSLRSDVRRLERELAASGIEAATAAETAQTGSAVGESPVPKADAQ